MILKKKYNLSKCKVEILNFIATFISTHGYSPSIREIGIGTHRTSSATVYAHVKDLKDMGYIDFKQGSNRTIRIIKSHIE